MNEKMDAQVKELRELARMKEELEAEIAAIQDNIKAVMTAQNTDELEGCDWKVTWKEVTTSRLDTSALKKTLPDIANRFMKITTSRRFCLA